MGHGGRGGRRRLASHLRPGQRDAAGRFAARTLQGRRDCGAELFQPALFVAGPIGAGRTAASASSPSTRCLSTGTRFGWKANSGTRSAGRRRRPLKWRFPAGNWTKLVLTVSWLSTMRRPVRARFRSRCCGRRRGRWNWSCGHMGNQTGGNVVGGFLAVPAGRLGLAGPGRRGGRRQRGAGPQPQKIEGLVRQGVAPPMASASPAARAALLCWHGRLGHVRRRLGRSPR